VIFSHHKLLPVLDEMRRLCGSRDVYVPFLASDGWGNPVDVRSKKARRYDLCGALIVAVDTFYEDDRLRAMLDDANATKRSYAGKELRRREKMGRVVYGYAWSLLEGASVEVTGCGLHERKAFEVAMSVLDRAKLRLCERLGVAVRDSGLGMARRGEPFRIEEVTLLAEIEEAGMGGATLETSDEVLASYDLYRRGLIVEVPDAPPWTYRLKHRPVL
jgi:hypothetical protein